MVTEAVASEGDVNTTIITEKVEDDTWKSCIITLFM